MSGKWTSGPWAVSQWSEITSGTDDDGDDLVLAATGRSHHSRGACSIVKGRAQHANAHLMAASPTMAEALFEAERFLDYFVNERRDFTGSGTPQAALEQVRQALSQALGEGE